ncbi:MAG: ABC transporter permease, partial [Dehalococcoidia bacterium]
IFRRLLAMVPTVFLVTLVVFVLIRMAPGDPVLNEFGLEVEAETIEARREELGLNRPIAVQYLDWVGRAFQGDFGRSIRARRPVVDEIKERLPATLQLAGLAFVVSVIVSVPLGMLTAVYPKTLFAKLTTFFTLSSISIPSFFVGTMLIYFFTYQWRIFETPRYVPFRDDPINNLRNLILPVLTLSYGLIAIWTRFIRSSVIESLGQDYIRTAHAKGLTQWNVVFRHAFRNAMIPAITLMSTSLAFLVSGSFITERIFNWPGLGRLSVTALLNRDFPVIQATIFVSAISLCVANLLADLLYAVADPRISYVRRR